MKISIIVAVYNAEKTINRLLKSLVNQTLEEFEIIIIDDGSTDRSLEICHSYANKDQRFKIYHQGNKGVSAARQKGADIATGDYIIHADADDYCEPKMLEELYCNAKTNNSDIVFCDYFSESSSGESKIRIQIPSTTAHDTLLALLSGKLHGSCWNKLVKKECLIKYKIRFPKDLNYCEDLLSWVQLFQHDDIKISYVPKAYYHYVDNTSSATRKGSHKMLAQIKLFTLRMSEILPKEDKEFEEYIKTLPIAPFQYAFQHKLISDKELRTEYFKLRKVIWKDVKSTRWKIGYLMIDFNFMNLARKFIKL